MLLGLAVGKRSGRRWGSGSQALSAGGGRCKTLRYTGSRPVWPVLWWHKQCGARARFSTPRRTTQPKQSQHTPVRPIEDRMPKRPTKAR